MNFRLIICSALISLTLYPQTASASTPTTTISAGTSLAVALNQLRSRELTILFSDRLVGAELKIKHDSIINDPRETALRLLAEHGLTLRALRPGLFAVVRLPPTEVPQRTESNDTKPLVEIAIYASRHFIESPVAASAQLGRAEIESFAGIDEDTLRAVQTLPGTASSPLSARTYVRGGHEDEMLVRFDGIPQLLPFHFKDYGSILGSIEPNTIESLDFYTGVFPVRHGDRLSAVMDIQPRSATNGNYHELGLSLLAVHALSVGESQIAGGKTRWLVAGRRSSEDWVIKAADIDDVDIGFSDLLLRGEHEIGNWSLIVGAKRLQDELEYAVEEDEEDEATEEIKAKYDDGTYWVRARHIDGDDRELTLSAAHFDLTAEREGRYPNGSIVAGEMSERRHSDGYYFEGLWKQPGAWSLGTEIVELQTRHDHTIEARFDPMLASSFGRLPNLQRQTFVDTKTRTVSAYASRLVRFSQDWRVDFGIRVDRRDQPRNSTHWSPRIAMEYELPSGRFFRASAGRVTQGQRSDELRIADGETVFHTVQKADQWVLGYEQLLTDRGSWRVEGYRKQIRDPAPRYENTLNPISLIPEMEIDRRRVSPDGALAYGVEFAGRYALDEYWSGFLNYAWSEVEDDFDQIDVPRNWNQQHAFMLGLLWQSGPWKLSGQGSWRTGWSRTAFSTSESGELVPVIGERNRDRWPAQWNLDLRATWRKPIEIGVLEVALDVNNATNRANPCCTDLRLTDGRLEARTRSWLPRYINVGVVWSLP